MGIFEKFGFGSSKPEPKLESTSDFTASPRRMEGTNAPTEEELSSVDIPKRIDYLTRRIDFLRNGQTNVGPYEEEEIRNLQQVLDSLKDKMTPKSY